MGMMWVAQYCTQLRSLNIVSCVQLTDATINAIAKGCTIPNHSKIYIQLLMAIRITGCTSLTSLDISNCCKITSLSLINVASSSPDLLSFKADGCYQITEDLLYVLPYPCFLYSWLQYSRVNLLSFPTVNRNLQNPVSSCRFYLWDSVTKLQIQVHPLIIPPILCCSAELFIMVRNRTDYVGMWKPARVGTHLVPYKQFRNGEGMLCHT